MKFIQSLRLRLDYFKNYKKYQEEEEIDVATISRLENQIRKNKEINKHELENKDMIINLQKEELEKKDTKIKKLKAVLEEKEALITKLMSDNNQLANVIEIKTEKTRKLKEEIHELQGTKGGLTKQNNKLKEALEELKHRYDFALTKIPKKSMEEIKAYIYGNKEVLKRIKESNNEQ